MTFGGATYRCVQAHTSQPDWTPTAVAALWSRVACAATVADAATQQALEAQGRSAPTAGTETTGIAAGQVGAGFVAAGQGERREIVSPGGERRTVRVVAPNLAPAIQ